MFIYIFVLVLISVFIYVYTILNDPKRLPIYIISLDRRPERGKFIMNRLGFSSKYYIAEKHAVDGKEKFIEPFISRPGEAGCFLSHIHMYKKFIDTPHDIALILEDDADIWLPEQWEMIENALKKSPSDWDVIWIGVNTILNPEKNVKINDDIYKLNSEAWGTHAYLITKNCAEYLYNKYQKLELYASVKDFNDVEPIDVLISKSNYINNYIITNSLIRQVANPSDTAA